jgi:hypothetical protein
MDDSTASSSLPILRPIGRAIQDRPHLSTPSGTWGLPAIEEALTPMASLAPGSLDAIMPSPAAHDQHMAETSGEEEGRVYGTLERRPSLLRPPLTSRSRPLRLSIVGDMLVSTARLVVPRVSDGGSGLVRRSVLLHSPHV